MSVNIDQIKRGVASYYETEIAQKATGVGKFAAYFMLPSVAGIVESKVDQLRGSPLAAGLISPDGLVDLDAVRERAQAAMQRCGSVEIMGFRLDQSDIDRLYDNIRRA